MRATSIILSVFLAVGVCQGITFTLADSALMSLDYNHGNHVGVTAVAENIAGPGVVFHLSYPGYGSQMYWLSSINGGTGALTGINIGGYDNFALDFTLLSVNGQANYSNGGGPVVSGAYLGIAYQPQVLQFGGTTHAVSSTSTSNSATTIERVGFVLNIPTWWYDSTNPSPWLPNGNTVDVLIKGADGAVAIPEPMTLVLLAAGFLALRMRRRYRLASPL